MGCFEDLEGDFALLAVATERMEHFDASTVVAAEDLYRELGITQEDWDAIGEVEIE